jgi:TPR repeat protein
LLPVSVNARPPSNQVEEGNDTAAYNLGMAYLKGSMGLDKDVAEATVLITKSADAGNAHAQFMLGIFALDGVGRDKDLALARRQFEAAATHGIASAQYNLGACLQNGWGGPADLEGAVSYYRAAAAQVGPTPALLPALRLGVAAWGPGRAR